MIATHLSPCTVNQDLKVLSLYLKEILVEARATRVQLADAIAEKALYA